MSSLVACFMKKCQIILQFCADCQRQIYVSAALAAQTVQKLFCESSGAKLSQFLPFVEDMLRLKRKYFFQTLRHL